MEVNNVKISFGRGYYYAPSVSIGDAFEDKKFILISYFLSGLTEVSRIEGFLERINVLDNATLDFEIGYGAGCLYVNDEIVHFETYGDDPNEVTIEMSMACFKTLVLNWRDFISSGQKLMEFKIDFLNTYPFFCKKMDANILRKYKLFEEHYLSKYNATTDNLNKITALAHFIGDCKNVIRKLLDKIKAGEKNISETYFMGYNYGLLTIDEEMLVFHPFKNSYGLVPYKFNTFEYQLIIDEWEVFDKVSENLES